jgi:hypothetical protein
LNKALHALRIGGDLRRQHLKRHASAETDIVGQIHGPHAALAQA